MTKKLEVCSSFFLEVFHTSFPSPATIFFPTNKKMWPCYCTHATHAFSCCSMATFFCFLEKKMVGSRKTCEKLREKTGYKLRAFWSTFTLSFFILPQNFRSNSSLVCKVPFVAAQCSLHMLIYLQNLLLRRLVEAVFGQKT